MNPLDLFTRRNPAILPPEDEWDLDEPTFLRREGTWQSGLRSVRERVLEWSTTVPTQPGWYWFRDPDNPTEPGVFQIKLGYRCVANGLEYAGPITTPTEALAT